MIYVKRSSAFSNIEVVDASDFGSVFLGRVSNLKRRFYVVQCEGSLV